MTVSVTASHLARSLRIALAFVEPEGFGGTESVYLEAGGGLLTATATDRHTLGHVRQTATGDWGGTGAIIGHRWADLLVQALDALADDDPVELSLGRGGKRLRLGHPNLVVLVPNTPWAIGSPKQWVDYRALFAKVEIAKPGLEAPVSLDPALIARFAYVHELLPVPWGTSAVPIQWTFIGEHAPVRVDIGDSFTGLIMPIRLRPEDSAAWPIPIRAVS